MAGQPRIATMALAGVSQFRPFDGEGDHNPRQRRLWQIVDRQPEQAERQKRVRACCMSQDRDIALTPRHPAGDGETRLTGQI